MKTNNMSFVAVWERYYPKFRTKWKLGDAQLGKLVYAMMEYQFYGMEPEKLSEKLTYVWEAIVEDLDRARVRYNAAVENGKKGGRPRKNPTETENNPEKPITRTRTESRTESKTRSITETESPEAACGEDLSVCQKAYGEFGWVRLTQEQYLQLQGMMGAAELDRCITYIDRAAQTTNNRNHWQDWALVLRRCHESRWHEAACPSDPIPKGASGVLGEAELEAIRRVMAD